MNQIMTQILSQRMMWFHHRSWGLHLTVNGLWICIALFQGLRNCPIAFHSWQSSSYDTLQQQKFQILMEYSLAQQEVVATTLVGKCRAAGVLSGFTMGIGLVSTSRMMQVTKH